MQRVSEQMQIENKLENKREHELHNSDGLNTASAFKMTPFRELVIKALEQKKFDHLFVMQMKYL